MTQTPTPLVEQHVLTWNISFGPRVLAESSHHQVSANKMEDLGRDLNHEKGAVWGVGEDAWHL